MILHYMYTALVLTYDAETSKECHHLVKRIYGGIEIGIIMMEYGECFIDECSICSENANLVMKVLHDY